MAQKKTTVVSGFEGFVPSREGISTAYWVEVEARLQRGETKKSAIRAELALERLRTKMKQSSRRAVRAKDL